MVITDKNYDKVVYYFDDEKRIDALFKSDDPRLFDDKYKENEDHSFAYKILTKDYVKGLVELSLIELNLRRRLELPTSTYLEAMLDPLAKEEESLGGL